MHGTSDAARDGVMDILLVTQNPRFDFLLGQDGTPTNIRDGEIGVPVLHVFDELNASGTTIVVVTHDPVVAHTRTPAHPHTRTH